MMTFLVIGASSAIAQAVIKRYCNDDSTKEVIAVTRPQESHAQTAELFRHPKVHYHYVNYHESDIASTCKTILNAAGDLSQVIICNGILHQADVQPEKSIAELSVSQLQTILQTNTIIPALWLGGLLTRLPRQSQCKIALLSARIGSITDNKLGGWYSYRSSKAALNMIIQTAAIELHRRAPQAKLIAFHPGTTDTPLSKPFQARVPKEKLFTPDFVAQRLLQILEQTEINGRASFLDYAGKPIPW